MTRAKRFAFFIPLAAAVILGGGWLLDVHDHQKALSERRALHGSGAGAGILSPQGQRLSVEETLDVLRQHAHDADPTMRRRVGALLEAMTDARADAELERALAEENLAVVAGGYRYVTTWRGKWSWPPRRRIRVLARAIAAYADADSMQDLLNDRDPEISQAAAAWASAHGYMVMPR